MTTSIDTTRLRALLDEATDPPEWSVATLAGCIRIVDTDGGIVATVSEATDAALIVGMRGSLRALLDEVERLRARPTWERVLRIANGCTDYGGGHHGADHEVYQHGIWTVCNVLKNACEQGDKPDMQLRVVEAIGAEALTPGEPEEGGTR